MIQPINVTGFYSKNYSAGKNRQINFTSKADVIKKLQSVQRLVKKSTIDETQSKKLYAELDSFECSVRSMVDKEYILQKKCEELEKENKELKQQRGETGSKKSFVESYVEFKESYDLGQIYSP